MNTLRSYAFSTQIVRRGQQVLTQYCHVLNVQMFIALQLLPYLKVSYISAYSVRVLISISRDQILANLIRWSEPFRQTIPLELRTVKDSQ